SGTSTRTQTVGAGVGFLGIGRFSRKLSGGEPERRISTQRCRRTEKPDRSVSVGESSLRIELRAQQSTRLGGCADAGDRGTRAIIRGFGDGLRMILWCRLVRGIIYPFPVCCSRETLRTETRRVCGSICWSVRS